jgi:hypothetical protein
MSADNGIYILKTIRTRKQEGDAWVKTEPYAVYRVAETCAIDNFDWYEKNQPYNLGSYMKDVWGSSPVFEGLQDADSYASKLEKDIPILEYGISSIDTDYVFYNDM